MKTDMGSGGLFGDLKRMLGSESFFVNTFTAGPGGGWVSLAPPTPDDIKSHELFPGADLPIQGSSFLGCPANVELDSKFQGLRGLVSDGERLLPARLRDRRPRRRLLQLLRRDRLKELRVEPGRELVVDTGHVVAFTNDVQYSIGKVGGIGSLIAGGEGLVLKFQRQRFRLGADAQAGVADGQADALLRPRRRAARTSEGQRGGEVASYASGAGQLLQVPQSP